MNEDSDSDDSRCGVDPPTILGLAEPLRMALSGIDLAPMRAGLMRRVERNPLDAGALMDLSVILQLEFRRDLALALQGRALSLHQLFRLPMSTRSVALRLLVLAAPGDFMTNTPVDLLLEESDVQIDTLCVAPHLPLPLRLPDHDVLFVAAGEPDLNRAALERIAMVISSSQRPALNRPDRITTLSRHQVSESLQRLPGVAMPTSARVSRNTLERIADRNAALGAYLPGADFPILARSIGSHAGMSLAKLDGAPSAADFLQTTSGDEFYICEFTDYRGPDGLFRKYRIALIDGRPFACHMGVSSDWMIHYANAGMAESAAKRAEEARFMAAFDDDFAVRHQEALRAIDSALDLDYAVIDCGETSGGDLLVFEVDTGAIIHAMDSIEIFPYEQSQMRKVFDAFRRMLSDAARDGRR